MSGETSAVPSSESPTGIEEVGLLSQDPSHGVLPVDGYLDVEDVTGGLPDIEDVEDITSLVEDAVSYEMPPPQNDFEDEFLAAEEGAVGVPGSGGGFAVFMKLAAALAIVAGGVLYGPGLYEQYFSGQGTETVASTGGRADPVGTSNQAGSQGSTGVKDPVGVSTTPNGGTAGGTDVATKDPNTGTSISVSAAGNAARAELGAWMTGVLASNFGASASDGR